ncbi:hypothetical protein Nepgr_007822 [Nepenthes gracilis]|uniref:Uncharacterized protein n=1 Tax=Nepenthes gracilis TaxID=150966 RepID=A0AAD3XIM1_NEPGR|nr:hypothetical protein Nepgr_007822 [Nepenthes gracilis]
MGLMLAVYACSAVWVGAVFSFLLLQYGKVWGLDFVMLIFGSLAVWAVSGCRRFVDMLSAGMLVNALDLMLLLLWGWAVLLIWLAVGSVLAGSLSAVILVPVFEVCLATGQLLKAFAPSLNEIVLILALGGWVRLMNSWPGMMHEEMLMLHGLLLGQDSNFILAGSLCWAMLQSNVADAGFLLAQHCYYLCYDFMPSIACFVGTDQL